MFSLHVRSENLDFLAYLHQESTFHSEDDVFLFSHIEQASRVLSRYLIYCMKEKHFHHMCLEVDFPKEDKDECFLYVSSDKMKRLYQFIFQKLLVFLSETSFFHFEGFIRFRLVSENEMIGKMVWLAYHEYIAYQEEPSTIHQLKRMMDEQPTHDEDLSVIVENDGTFTIKSDEHVYLSGETEEDTLLSHLILLSPQTLRVFEKGGHLTPTYSVLLTQLFEKKVMFYGLNSRPSAHQKKEK